ncbi:MAG: hypothetical protein ACOYMA_01650 [Bacteroidia bacterium]
MKCVVNDKHEKIKYIFIKDNYDIYICEECKSIMADVSFVHEQYESDDYYTVKNTNIEYIEKFWGFRIEYILNKIKKYKIGSLLDIGAGNGYFVWKARNKYNINCEGTEIA